MISATNMALRVAVLIAAFASVVVAENSNVKAKGIKFDEYGRTRQRLVAHAAGRDLHLKPVLHNHIQDFGLRTCRYANQARAQFGLYQLYYSASLTNLAARHSQWMAYHNTLQHQNLKGLGVQVYHWWLPITAENIAEFTPRSSDPSWDAHQLWYYSSGHFRNMMSSRHTHCGVGIVSDRSSRWWATQLFGYNAEFGNEGGSTSRVLAASSASAPTGTPTSDPAGGSDGVNIPSFDLES